MPGKSIGSRVYASIVAMSAFAIALQASGERTISTVAGTGIETLNAIGNPLSTNIGNPFGVEVTNNGDLYICEVSNHRLWKLTKNQRILLVAGTGRKGLAVDGQLATEANLNEPYEVRIARNGDVFFVEMQNHLVRRIDASTGKTTIVAGNGMPGFAGDGGIATKANLNRPHSIALDGDSLYIADIGNHRIRRVDLKSGRIESFAGTTERKLPKPGAAVTGQPVLGPRALFIQRGIMWIALREGHSVWRIDLRNPRWEHVAGTGQKGYSGDEGPAADATFNGPKGIAVDARGHIYVVDTENQAIRMIDGKTKIITTVAGVGPKQRGYRGDSLPARKAWLARPHGICVDDDGNLYIGDSENHRVRRVSAP